MNILKEKNFLLCFISIIYLTVLLSGERMAFILLTTCLIIFLYFYIKLKNFIILFLLITFSGLILLTNNNYVKHRYKSFNIDVVNYKDSGHGRIFFISNTNLAKKQIFWCWT